MCESREQVVQLRLRTLFVWMAFVSVMGGAFASGARYWQTVIDYVILILLGGALVASVATEGSKRVFWFAFFVFTTVYLLATYSGVTFLGVRKPVITNDWVSDLAKQFHPRIEVRGIWRFTSETSVASNVGFRAVAIVVGTVAAYICRGVYVFSRRKELLRRSD